MEGALKLGHREGKVKVSLEVEFWSRSKKGCGKKSADVLNEECNMSLLTNIDVVWPFNYQSKLLLTKTEIN